LRAWGCSFEVAATTSLAAGIGDTAILHLGMVAVVWRAVVR